MIKIILHIFAVMITSASSLYASGKALAGYDVGCQHEKFLMPEVLKPFVINDSAGYRAKLRMTWEAYKSYYLLIQRYPYFSIVIDDAPGDCTSFP